MKHRGSFSHRMDAPDRHNRQRQTNGRTVWTDGRKDASLRPSVRPSVCKMEFDTYCRVFALPLDIVWLLSAMVRLPDSRSKDPGFGSHPQRSQILHKLLIYFRHPAVSYGASGRAAAR